MGTANSGHRLTYDQRLKRLSATKLQQTIEKQQIVGTMDHDDWALILPPEDKRSVVETISSSGMPIKDVLLKGFAIKSNHPNGGFYEPRTCGENFRALLEVHPEYIDPMSSLAGGYMVNFNSYRKARWNPDYSYAHLEENQKKYQLITGIGASQHFCQDLNIGLKKGWDGILKDIRYYRNLRSDDSQDFYAGLEHVVLGIKNWINRTADKAASLADKEGDPVIRQNLQDMARINKHLVTEPPRTLREACQWILWFQIISRMYNGSGSLGRLDELLYPFYQQDKKLGKLDDEEAIFHIACLLLRDTSYLQVGGETAAGFDTTNEVSFLVLEAVHKLKIPANLGVSVGKNIDQALLRRGVEIMLEDKTGIPKFLGHDTCINDYTKNGHPIELTRQRAYAGCHWYGIPGREYTIMDTVKINFAAILQVAFNDIMADKNINPSMAELTKRFQSHLKAAVYTIAAGLDFHLEYNHKVFPELVMDLLCYGPIEKGLDASHGGIEFYNMCVDGAGLATVADSFAALKQRIEDEKIYTWQEIAEFLENDWTGAEGKRARQYMKNIPRFGTGNSLADKFAHDIVDMFTRFVKEKPTPNGYSMVPGLFSWANTIPMGKTLAATPNGRYAGDPISHGANPDPGFRKDNAATALAVAVAAVQPGYGNAAPLQIELDPASVAGENRVNYVMSLIKTHFSLGGTQINMNILDKDKILAAHQDPTKHLDLVVRVTGFSAYFASLSPKFRQLVVDRIVGI